MELYYSFSILIVLATIFEFINHRLLRLPSAIGIMIIAVSISLILAMFGVALLPISHHEDRFYGDIDGSDA